MKTLSYIIPNPINTNNLLNTKYSTSTFATSDFNGKSNTEVLRKFKDNSMTNKIDENLYVGGIGEVGIVMENIDYINNVLNQNNGNIIKCDGKFASSTFYGKHKTYEQYTNGNADNVWYYDGSYGMINHGSFNDQYKVLSLYKYDINDFHKDNKKYEEYDNNDLYIVQDILIDYDVCIKYESFGIENNTLDIDDENFNRISYDLSQYEYTEDNNGYIYIRKFRSLNIKNILEDPNVTPYKYEYLYEENGILYVTNEDYEQISYDLSQYEYTEDNNGYIYIRIKLSNFDLMSCIYYCQDDTLDDLKNTTNYYFFRNDKKNNMYLNNNDNIIKYPIYYNEQNNVYSMPLLPKYRDNNYYDCEFYIILPEFTQNQKNIYDAEKIYNNVKIVICFGDNELVETLNPYIKLKDGVVYKFNKQWLFDYMFIHNQELNISIVTDDVLISKKAYFNLFKILLYQKQDNFKDLQVKLDNYFPLKYPLKSKQKFFDINYVPFENIQNYNYDQITSVEINNKNNNLKLGEKNISFLDLTNNYAYLNSTINHNLNEGNNMVDWFTIQNGNGIIIDKNINEENNYSYAYTYLNFSIENREFMNNYNDDNVINLYQKTFANYDKDGILDSVAPKIIELNHNCSYINNDELRLENFKKNIYGLKQIIYIPYQYNIGDGWNGVNNIGFKRNNRSSFSIFEDHVFVYNNTDDDIKLFFNDESLTLCENTKIINISAKSIKYYKPSKHKNYNIIIKNCFINNYRLSYYNVYNIKNNSNDVLNYISGIMNNLSASNLNTRINSVNNNYNNLIYKDNNIIKVPIYDFTNPQIGHIIYIDKINN